MTPSPKEFKKLIFDHYSNHGRTFLWRDTTNPYYIWLSEIMLQQTQTSRVVEYYTKFTHNYPQISDLANASQQQVLKDWQGLGYNRRALNLHNAAKEITNVHNSQVPNQKEILVALPGIGDATAGAILCYAFNIPCAFIETNIRTVFIHEFFKDKVSVSDKEILPLVVETMDRENPRDWFYALTDYGVYLKNTVGNESTKSKHYTKQSTFEGSNRQKRSTILRALLNKELSIQEISEHTGFSMKEIKRPLTELLQEKFVTKENKRYRVL